MYKKCEQYKCCYQAQPDGCPVCDECSAPPLQLNADDNCTNCWCCQGDEGFIRSGKSARQLMEAKLIKVIAQVIKNGGEEE